MAFRKFLTVRDLQVSAGPRGCSRPAAGQRPGCGRALALAGLVLAGCDTDGTGPDTAEPASLTIEAPDSVVSIGERLTVAAVVRDENGEVLSDATVHWTTTDSSTATVDAAGAVSGVAIGYVDIVATGAGLGDTLRVRVHDAAVPDAKLRLRFMADDITTDLSGFMRFIDTMRGVELDETGLVGEPNGIARDTVLTIIMPSAPASTRQLLTPFPLDLGEPVGPVALLRLGRAQDGDLEYFASVDAGWIDFDIIEPPAPGWRVGSATGFLHLPLVRLAPNPGGPPILTDDTVLVHVNVRVSLQHVLRGSAVVTLEGGPVEGTSVLSNAWAGDDGHGGWFYAWDADLDGLGSGPGRWELNQELRVLAPAVGEFAMPRFTGPQFDQPALWPERFSSIFLRDDPRIALITSGTLRIDRYVAPTLEDYGEIEGSLTGRFELWIDSITPSGDTIDALTLFSVAVYPEVGAPPAPPAGDQWPVLPPFATAARPLGTDAPRSLHRR